MMTASFSIKLAKDGAAAFWITCLGSHDHGENLAFLFFSLGRIIQLVLDCDLHE